MYSGMKFVDFKVLQCLLNLLCRNCHLLTLFLQSTKLCLYIYSVYVALYSANKFQTNNLTDCEFLFSKSTRTSLSKFLVICIQCLILKNTKLAFSNINTSKNQNISVHKFIF